MIFLELVLQNFGPYVGRQIINLRPENNDNSCPIILFGGMNGGGKTTLMDAIRLAFYGHRAQCSTRGNLSYGEFLTQSVNRNAHPLEETSIELTFEDILNNVQVEFRIKRTWTINPKGGKDTLYVSCDRWLDDSLTKTWDERIEELLPLGISNLFLFDGEQVKELAELETPPPIVVEAIESLLGLELTERLSVDLDILVNRKRKANADTKESITIEEIEERLQHQQEQYQVAKEKIASCQNQLDRAHKEQQQAFEKFISEGGKLAGERSQLEKQIRGLSEETERSRNQLCEQAAGILPLALIQPLLTQSYNQGKIELRRQQALLARDVLLERDKRLLNLILGLEIYEDKLDKIKTFLEQENQQLNQEIAAKHESWLAVETDTLSLLENLSNYLLQTDLKIAIEQLTVLKDREEEITVAEKQLAAAAPPEVYEKLAEAIRQTQTKLSEAKTNYEIAKRRLDELAASINKTKKALEQYTEQNIYHKNNDHIIAASAKVQETLKLFREKLTLRKLNKLELEVTECFRYLLHKSDLVHRVAIDTNTFSLSLYDFQGKAVPKHRLSAGEKQLLAIAFLWGLARVSGRRLPVAIDTPLGRLDSSHRQNLVERYFPSASHQVILLSTDTEIGSNEVKKLRENEAIAREYLLKYDSSNRQTTIESGYFW